VSVTRQSCCVEENEVQQQHRVYITNGNSHFATGIHGNEDGIVREWEFCAGMGWNSHRAMHSVVGWPGQLTMRQTTCVIGLNSIMETIMLFKLGAVWCALCAFRVYGTGLEKT